MTEMDLPDVDLLTAVLGSRRAAANLLRGATNLATLSRLETASIADLSGAGRARARRIGLALELARRVHREERAGRGVAIRGPAEAYALMAPRIAHLDHEELWLLALDGNNGLRGTRRLAMGGACGLAIAQEDVLRAALASGGRGFVLCHNHPSNDPTPSAADLTFTARVAAGSAFVGVRLLDHVVIARGGFAQVPFDPGPPAPARERRSRAAAAAV